LATISGAGISHFDIKDNSGVSAVEFWRTGTGNHADFSSVLLPTADNTYNVGSSAARWKDVEAINFIARTAASGTRLFQMSGGTLLGIDGGGTTEFSVSSLTGQILSGALSGGGVKCLESDNSGNINLASASCTSNPTTTTGDMIYRNSGGSLARLAIGASNQMLFSNGSTPFWATLNTLYATLLPSVTATYDLGSASFKYQNAYANNFIGASYQFSSPVGNRCLDTNVSGIFTEMAADCVTTARTVSTTSPLGGGGALSSNLTLTCTTCVTTAGGQSISGTTTLSTLSVSTAISGTYNLSGNETVTGNWYNRTFSGGDANCSGVADGWQGVRTDTGGASGKPQVEICIGAAMKYIALN
jgi:hypothetical protein